MDKMFTRKEAEKMNKEVLVEFLLLIQANFDDLKKQNEVLTIQLNDLNANFKILLEQFNVAQSARFGRSSEKMNYIQEEQAKIAQVNLPKLAFNEAEHTVEQSSEVQLEEPLLKDVAPRKKKTKGKRDRDLQDLPQAKPIYSELSHDEIVEQETYSRFT